MCYSALSGCVPLIKIFFISFAIVSSICILHCSSMSSPGHRTTAWLWQNHKTWLTCGEPWPQPHPATSGDIVTLTARRGPSPYVGVGPDGWLWHVQKSGQTPESTFWNEIKNTNIRLPTYFRSGAHSYSFIIWISFQFPSFCLQNILKVATLVDLGTAGDGKGQNLGPWRFHSFSWSVLSLAYQ